MVVVTNAADEHQQELIIRKKERDSLREPLRFVFSGLSIWLEIDGCQHGGDFHSCIQACAAAFDLEPIPAGHVTAIYGMTHLTEQEAIHKFLNHVKPQLLERTCKWPSLQPIGLLSDVELNGVNDGQMDMAWSEITFSTSEEHESCIDLLHEIFYESKNVRQGQQWRPHASLVYDNPVPTPINLLDTAKIVSQYPSLTSMAAPVVALSLWRTEGRISDWRRIERFEF